MITVFLGTDILAARTAFRARRDAFRGAHPGALEVSFDADHCEGFADVPGMENLFGGGKILCVDGIAGTAEGLEFLVDVVPTLSGWEVLIREDKLLKDARETLTRGGAVIELFEKKKEERGGTENFVFAEYVLAKDRQRAWVALMRAFESGASPEAIHGALSWAVRTALIARHVTSEDEAALCGLKGYPYTKAKRAAAGFNAGELEALLARVNSAAERGHSSETSLAHELERIALWMPLPESGE